MIGLLVSLGLAALAQFPPGNSPALEQEGTLAVAYCWKANPGKIEEYDRYIRDVAEPIDRAARRAGAFISVTTYVSRSEDSPWTHMRIFVLKDRLQLEGLSAALDAAGTRLEPDAGKRKARSEYAATLRTLVSREVLDILK